MNEKINALRDELAPLIAAATQQAVARATGIPQANISAWLAGRRPMPLDRIAQIAAAVGLELHVELRRRRVTRILSSSCR